eukprot:173062-Chlamydomonas_euryale.AAC.2
MSAHKGRMDGWMDGRMGVWEDGSMDAWLSKQPLSVHPFSIHGDEYRVETHGCLPRRAQAMQIIQAGRYTGQVELIHGAGGADTRG